MAPGYLCNSLLTRSSYGRASAKAFFLPCGPVDGERCESTPFIPYDNALPLLVAWSFKQWDYLVPPFFSSQRSDSQEQRISGRALLPAKRKAPGLRGPRARSFLRTASMPSRITDGS